MVGGIQLLKEFPISSFACLKPQNHFSGLLPSGERWEGASLGRPQVGLSLGVRDLGFVRNQPDGGGHFLGGENGGNLQI